LVAIKKITDSYELLATLVNVLTLKNQLLGVIQLPKSLLHKSESYVEVTIDESQITVVKDVRKTDGDRNWTDTMILNFNEDHSTYTLTGYIGDDMPSQCIGELTGSGQRLHHIHIEN
jgi:hypothetical protein